MIRENTTETKEFILVGLTENHQLRVPLFILFTFVYVITILGNSGIVTLISVSPLLQTPMYFLLSNLSFVDLCYSSVITPKMLENFLSIRKSISFNACVAQLYLFAVFATSECFLVTAMAYDRFVAICHPLLYTTMMSNDVCSKLVAGAYVGGLLPSVAHALCVFLFPFCKSNRINHFYCDIPPLLKLSCNPSYISKAIVFGLAISLGLASLSVILTSYVYIISAVTGISSTEGKSRAFSTCTSHLTVVLLFYGTVFFMYMRPGSGSSEDVDKLFAVFYTVVSPMLNPMIYSLRNTDVKAALRKVMTCLIQKF
ncbi:olfactory receptor 5B21-like [Lissotriton helveticus]